MYDITQLNELLVPELHDIAEELNIPNSKKMNKQELVSTILEKQTNMATDKNSGTEKPKRKRILKSDKEAAEENIPAEAPQKETVRAKKTDTEKKPPVKKAKAG